MQEKSYNNLLNSAFDPALDKPEKVKQTIRDIARTNYDAVKAMPPDQQTGLRSPSEQELLQIRQYMIDYKKQNPYATKREVRKAAQEKFKVKIFRPPHRWEQNQKTAK